MNRFAAVALVLAALAASCGVSRESEDVLAEVPTTVADESSAAAGTEAEATPEATTTTIARAPSTTGVPTETVAAANFGSSSADITHGDLNDIVAPTLASEDFTVLVFGGFPPENFGSEVLGEMITNSAFDAELAERGIEVTESQLTESRESLMTVVESLYAGEPDAPARATALYAEVPYLELITQLQAKQQLLVSAFNETADPSQLLPCVSHILVETEDEANQLLAELEGGADFGELAAANSTDPSAATNGGDLGCAPSANYVPPFAEAVDNAEEGVYVGPVQTDFGFHILIVTGAEADPQLAFAAIDGRLGAATVDIDPNFGSWDSVTRSVLPAQ